MSFPRYPKYKSSGVEWLGEVPEHWEMTQGRRQFTQERESARPTDDQLSATQKYGVVPQKLFMEMEDQKVTLALSGLDNFKHVEEDDFVISLRSFQGGIERSKYAGCVSPAYTVLRSVNPIDASFWGYLLKSRGYIEALQTMTDGIRDGKNISYPQFGQIRVPVFPLSEQTQIAEFLDRETAKIDGLVAEQRRLMELLKEKRQAVISHAVTQGLNPKAAMKPSGIEWLGDVPEHWEVKKLFYLLSEPPKNGVSPEVSAEGSTPTFSIAAVRNGNVDIENHLKFALIELKAAQQYFVKQNDILVLRGNGSKDLVGTAGIVSSAPPENCIYPDILIRIRPNDLVMPAYLVATLNSTALRPQIQTAAQTAAGIWKISGSSLQALRLPAPPLEEQAAIISFLDTELAKFDTLTAEAQRAIDLLQERRTALISAAVTGQIDVRAAR